MKTVLKNNTVNKEKKAVTSSIKKNIKNELSMQISSNKEKTIWNELPHKKILWENILEDWRNETYRNMDECSKH